MEATEFYPDLSSPQPRPAVPALPSPADRAPEQSQADLAARVEELERVVAALAALDRDRYATPPRDPVALTSALHPRGFRGQRSPARGSSADGSLGVRFVVFDKTRDT